MEPRGAQQKELLKRRPTFRERAARRAIYAFARTVVPLLCRPEIRGSLSQRERLVLVGNHVSHFDPLLLIYATGKQGVHPQAWLTRNLFKPVLAQLLRTAGHGPVKFIRRNDHRVDVSQTDIAGLIHQGAVDVANGDVLAGYPGGRITHDPELRPEKALRGLAAVAVLAGAPIQVISHLGGQNIIPHEGSIPNQILTAAKRLWEPGKRPRVIIQFGKVINPRVDSIPLRSPTKPDDSTDTRTVSYLRELAEDGVLAKAREDTNLVVAAMQEAHDQLIKEDSRLANNPDPTHGKDYLRIHPSHPDYGKLKGRPQ